MEMQPKPHTDSILYTFAIRLYSRKTELIPHRKYVAIPH